MSWLQMLVDTYDNCMQEIGKIVMVKRKKEEVPLVPLLPLCHTTQIAQIEITIDREGNWVPLGARVLTKGEGVTIIPCTESSAGRTSSPCPHPLFDKLPYIAGDYAAYGGEKKGGYEPVSYTHLDVYKRQPAGRRKIREAAAIRRPPSPTGADTAMPVPPVPPSWPGRIGEKRFPTAHPQPAAATPADSAASTGTGR